MLASTGTGGYPHRAATWHRGTGQVQQGAGDPERVEAT